jgi:sugar phosphate isomerase/epimerase
VLDAPPPQLVTAAARAGFDAVGVRVRPAADEPAYPMLDDTQMMRETVARLADTGTRVLDVEVLRLRPDSRHEDALRILDAGVRLGARAALVICNDPDEARLVDRLAAVCAAAGERGLRACLEFMIFSSVRTLADALRIVQRTAHPAGAILVDALHLQRSGGTPAEVAATRNRLLPYAPLCDASLLRRYGHRSGSPSPRPGPVGSYRATVNCRCGRSSTRCRKGRRSRSSHRSPDSPAGGRLRWPTSPTPR